MLINDVILQKGKKKIEKKKRKNQNLSLKALTKLLS